MNVIEKNILRDVLKHGNAMERKRLIRRFPIHLRSKVPASIEQLKQSGYLVEDVGGLGSILSVPKFMNRDAVRSVSPLSKDYSKAIEEIIPKKYTSPFLITEGEHNSRYGIAKYVFCAKKKNTDDITCFLVKNSKYTSIHLGSIYDSESLVSWFIDEIDAKVGKKEFTKEYLQTILPKEIVGNRQPLKALTDYLSHLRFLKRIEYPNATKFVRTHKTRQITTLDKVIPVVEPQQTITISSNNGRFAYSDEDGLYPILY
jgi:hypothetical protein